MNEPRAPALVTTKPAADAIGVHPATLWRYYREGLVTPAATTPKGQTRWDIEDLVRQVAEMRRERARKKLLVPRARRRAQEIVYIDGVRVRDEAD